MKNLTRSCQRCVTLCLLSVLWTSTVVAQTAPPPPNAAPVISSSRSWYFEGLVVIVMFALALFVVCRSSRRN